MKWKLTGGLAVAVAAVLAPTAASAAKAGCGDWTADPVAYGSDYANSITDIDATSESHAWAVGFSYPGSGVTSTWINRWNGSAWTSVPAVNPSAVNNRLLAVEAVSQSDAWAVGSWYETGVEGGQRPLLLRYVDGQWQRVLVPLPPEADGVAYSLGLDDVVASSADNVWIVGHLILHRADGPDDRVGVAYRWDGAGLVSAPSPHNFRTHRLAASDKGPVYAYGIEAASGMPADRQSTLMRWDRSQWVRVPAPIDVLGPDAQGTLSVLSPTDVRLLGAKVVQVDGAPTPTPEIAQITWNGRAWSQKIIPPLSVDPVALHDVEYSGAREALAGGLERNELEGNQSPFLMQWDGQRWTRRSLPEFTPGGINSVAAVAYGGRRSWVALQNGLDSSEGIRPTFSIFRGCR